MNADQPDRAGSSPLTIWCNAHLPPAALARLREKLGARRLVLPASLGTSNLVATGPDPSLEQADVALGQPDAGQVAALPRLRWVHLTSAGYTRYDTPAVRDALRGRKAALTNSSSVYDEPCAQHLLAMIMALSRRLPDCWDEQRGPRNWRDAHHRIRARLLNGQSAVLFGYGAIARRLTQLLAPLGMNLAGVRRKPSGDEPIRVVATESADELLAGADHVVNILPAAEGTARYFNAARLAKIKTGAVFYNIGRGTTVETDALRAALVSGRLSAAYLDVTDPEPLPAGHLLWETPNCYVTPHIAGGSVDEFDRLVDHFLRNLDRFEAGEPMADRIV